MAKTDYIATIKLSEGNRKMVNGFLIWNLPEIKTCIGCTAFCIKYCYARKASLQYPNVVPGSREFNYQQSLMDDFREAMIAKIDTISKRSKKFRGYFRIHESGDFYSQKYLDDWKAIAATFPEIKFLAFTKSYQLDFSNLSDNFQVIYSVMPDTTHVLDDMTRAYAGDSEYDPKTTIECPGNCDTCLACWGLAAKGMNVHFAIH